MTTQTSFLGGEVSSLAAMRYDKPFHANGMERLLNQALRLQGACETRPGAVDHGGLEGGESIGFDWTFSPTQSYAILLSAGRFDVVSNQTHEVVDAEGGMPWTVAQFEQITVAQQLDTMVVCHPDFSPVIIRRQSATEFQASVIVFDVTAVAGGQRVLQPHYKFAAAAITLTPSDTSGIVTLTASDAVFRPEHAGVRFRIKDKEVSISSVTSPLIATAFCVEVLADATATADWTEAVFSVARGGARTAAFYGDRLILGGAREYPLGWWASRIGRYWNFDKGTSQDNEAIWESVGDDVSEIRHMIIDRHLLVFGDRRYFMVANSETTPLTPKNFKAPPQDPVGASYCRPVHFDGGVAFVQADSTIVRCARYNDIDQRYEVDALNLISPHLVNDIRSLAAAFATAPRQENYAHAVNGDGTLAVCLSNNQAQIQAWTPWQLGGGIAVRDAICVGDTTWLVVRRGSGYRLMRMDWDAAPLDMSVPSDTLDAPDYDFPGFGMFAGETVDVYANGHTLGSCPVDSDGVLHLPAYGPPASMVIAGYAFSQRLRPLPLIQATQSGSTHGRVLGLRRVHVDVEDCGYFLVEGAPPPVTTGLDPDTLAQTYTGIVTAYVLGYGDAAQCDLATCDLPQKLRFRGFTREVVLGG